MNIFWRRFRGRNTTLTFREQDVRLCGSKAPSMVPVSTKLDFEELYSLKQFVDQLRQTHVDALQAFADEKPEYGFRLFAAQPQDCLMISSSAASIGSLL